MSCNCKNGKSMDNILKENNVSKSKSVLKYALKTIAFSIFVIFSPIIYFYILWVGFKILLLNEGVDISSMVSFIGKNFKEKTSDDDNFYDKDEEIDSNDYVLVEVDDITNKN